MPYDLPSNEIHSRIIKLLDGNDYLIAMGGWYWNSLDWINDNTDWSFDDYIGMAWRGSRELIAEGTAKYPDNFLAEFTLCLKFAIKEHMTEIIAEEDRREAIQAEAGK